MLGDVNLEPTLTMFLSFLLFFFIPSRLPSLVSHPPLGRVLNNIKNKGNAERDGIYTKEKMKNENEMTFCRGEKTYEIPTERSE